MFGFRIISMDITNHQKTTPNQSVWLQLSGSVLQNPFVDLFGSRCLKFVLCLDLFWKVSRFVDVPENLLHILTKPYPPKDEYKI